METPAAYSCPECQVGFLRPRHSSYFTEHDGQVVSVPDFPAWVCDVCGRREYDHTALAELQAMLQTNRRGRRGRLLRRASNDADQPLASSGTRRRP